MDVLLRMEGIQKAFSGIPALQNAGLELHRGEVLALMGENGAGKSTLMKILTGIYQKDTGRVLYDRGQGLEEVTYHGPKDSERDGIAIVHQELNLLKDLTVAQNLFLGREDMAGLFIKDRQLEEKARVVFESLKIHIHPGELMDRLTVGQQQMVEIAKVILQEARLIVFDEPTAALTDSEIDQLFEIIHSLRKKGIGIIYISHRMDEIHRITDRVTVMRDGETVGSLVTATSSKDDIIKMMVGRVIFEDPKSAPSVGEDSDVVLEVRGISCGKAVQDCSFQLRRGEILGFAGLMGAGRTELARAIFGADRKDRGEIFIEGQLVEIKDPHDAVQYGIGYLSEDRKRYGILVDKAVDENIGLTDFNQIVRGSFVDEKKLEARAEEYVQSLRIKTPSVKQEVRKLSGGNQQKVVIAKWLMRNSQIIIFDEPTRGIDVGAKSEIYALMHELVAAGKSIIMISSELPEILRMSDRVAVMCEGRISEIIPIDKANQENIMSAATRSIVI
ncbi:MAG: sugar ABC transporter ATP-binding protein [Eubacteriales bacterium]|nr:sugar ABC transporter ATP-binding protein [Eubacteriales bacterium]